MSEETGLTIVERPQIMSLAEAQARRDALSAFVAEKVLVKDIDYGKVPGTEKDTLFKPGAEKLATFFHLTPKFVVLDKLLDFDSGLFYFQYACQLSTRDGMLVGTGNGSCNSHESKYRWRTGDRLCPECGAATVIKGKEKYGGGWLCWRKRGGCGAKFPDGDERITSQITGRVENPDPADQLNTIDKMAQKRALVAAVLIAVNASEFFTQDLEDMSERAFEPSPPNRSEAVRSQEERAAPERLTQKNKPAPRQATDWSKWTNLRFEIADESDMTDDEALVRLGELEAAGKINGGMSPQNIKTVVLNLIPEEAALDK